MIAQHKNTQNGRAVCAISFGSNLSNEFGEPIQLIEAAIGEFSSCDLFLVESSSIYHTPSFPPGSGPDFVNGAFTCETSLPPNKVLQVLHRIESLLGRTRTERWEPRVIDLDLIAYDNIVLPDQVTHQRWRDLQLSDQMQQAPEQLILPHPRVQDRPFVLVPLREVLPDWVHPVTGQSVDQMLARFTAAELAEIRVLE